MTNSQNQNPFVEFVKWCLKWIATIGCAIAILCLCVWVSKYGWNYLTVERHKKNIQVIVLYYHTEIDENTGQAEMVCSEDYPFTIIVANNSKRTIDDITLKIEGRLPDRSSNIMNYNASVKSDYIQKPGEYNGTCWRLSFDREYKEHPDLKSAKYIANIVSVNFAPRGRS